MQIQTQKVDMVIPSIDYDSRDITKTKVNVSVVLGYLQHA